MKNNSILIISNNSEIGAKISDKIKLLRECDTIKVVSFLESISVLNSTQPTLMIIYCGKTDSTGIIKEVRSIPALDKVPIIFVMDSLVEDILFYAFDNGIDDFFFLTDPDSIILMRIFLTLQKSVMYKQAEINNQIMVSAKIIDSQTGLYSKDYVQTVFRHFFSKSIEENAEDTVFMYVKPMPLDKKRINISKIANVIKKTVRGNDIVAFGKGIGFYLILYSAGLKGSKSLAQRIQNVLANDCKLYINATEVTTSFEEMEQALYLGMKNQIELGEKFNYINDLKKFIPVSEIVIKDENGKTFDDFKKEFFASFEKIVAPVFYQMQSSYSEKLPEAEIKFNINETESNFSIKKDSFTSELVITYPTYIKLIMDIKHFAKDEKPLIRRITFDFEDFSEEKLTSILTDVINEFTQRINLDLMKQPE